MVGGSWRTWREPMQTQGEHADYTQKGTSRPMDLNPGPSRCEASVLLTTSPLFRPSLSIVEVKTVRVEGRVGKDVTFKCSNWNAWSNARDNVKYLCFSPCKEDKHLIIKADFEKTASKDRIWITNTGEGLFVTFKNLQMSDSRKYYCGVDRFFRDTLIEVNLKVLDVELPVPKTSAKPVTVGSTVSSAVSSSNLDITTDMLVSYSTIYMTPTASAVVPAEATYFLIVLAATVTTVIILLVIMKNVKRQQKIVTSADSPPEDPQESAGPDGDYEMLQRSTMDPNQVYSTLDECCS